MYPKHTGCDIIWILRFFSVQIVQVGLMHVGDCAGRANACWRKLATKCKATSVRATDIFDVIVRRV